MDGELEDPEADGMTHSAPQLVDAARRRLASVVALIAARAPVGLLRRRTLLATATVAVTTAVDGSADGRNAAAAICQRVQLVEVVAKVIVVLDADAGRTRDQHRVGAAVA